MSGVNRIIRATEFVTQYKGKPSKGGKVSGQKGGQDQNRKKLELAAAKFNEWVLGVIEERIEETKRGEAKSTYNKGRPVIRIVLHPSDILCRVGGDDAAPGQFGENNVPSDVILYGHRSDSGLWTERVDLGLPEKPFVALQRLLHSRGWYLVEESDPNLSKSVVLMLYAVRPDGSHKYFNKGLLWHGNDMFPDDLE